MKVWFALAVGCTTAFAQIGEVRGVVLDGRGGETLARVEVQLIGSSQRALTDGSGRFRLGAVAAGEYTLNVSTVGYRMVKKPFTLGAGETKEFEVVLSPDTLRQVEHVDVKADPFEPARQDSPSSMVLAGNDAKNLASVLADDPLRAVQGLPGVSSNDDYEARFSLRGADYSRMGLYLDGILLHGPFHTIQNQSSTGSASAFNNDTVESIELHSGAFPVRFADRTAGALDIHTRDGSRSGTSMRATASASNAGLMGEGRLGEHGSWIAGGRKSYLQYLLERTNADSSIVFGMWDTQARLAYDLTAHHHVSLSLLEGESDLDRSSARSRLGANSLLGASYHYTLANLAWSYTPSRSWLLTSRGAYMREKFDNYNPQDLQLGAGHYGEWVWNSSATWMWNERSPLEAGVSVRRLRDSGFTNQYQFNPLAVRRLDQYDGTALRAGGYVQQSWNAWAGRLYLNAGMRWDGHPVSGIVAASPQASAAVSLWSGARLQLGFGQNAQYPEIALLYSPTGGRALLPERSTHFIAALEQRLDQRTRFRVEFYNRSDRDLLFRSLEEPRLVNGRIVAPAATPLIRNSDRGYARGIEMFVQRSSANRLTGWVSYALGYTRVRDGVLHLAWPSDYDQRHTVNIYGGYRLRPTVNLSVRWLYGSGFPVPGFFRIENRSYFLNSDRNGARLPDYQRLDFRVNKSWAFQRWKLTLYGEVVNLTNHGNFRFDSYNGYNARTAIANVALGKLFPILPSAGIVFER